MCVPSFKVIDEVVHRDGGGGPICLRLISAETRNFITKILTKFLSVLSCKFHQSRSTLSF